MDIDFTNANTKMTVKKSLHGLTRGKAVVELCALCKHRSRPARASAQDRSAEEKTDWDWRWPVFECCLLLDTSNAL